MAKLTQTITPGHNSPVGRNFLPPRRSWTPAEALEPPTLPRTLLDRLVGDEQERVLRCLRLLSPLSHTPLMRQRFAMEG